MRKDILLLKKALEWYRHVYGLSLIGNFVRLSARNNSVSTYILHLTKFSRAWIFCSPSQKWLFNICGWLELRCKNSSVSVSDLARICHDDLIIQHEAWEEEFNLVSPVENCIFQATWLPTPTWLPTYLTTCGPASWSLCVGLIIQHERKNLAYFLLSKITKSKTYTFVFPSI